MLIAAASTHLVSLACSVLVPAEKSFLFVVLPCLNLSEILSLPIDHVLPTCIDSTNLVTWSTLAID